uniref:Putative Biopolymer transport protein MotA/TolQ/ExbB n=1 Tax=mine drainage metagenome TaxID=410659 RepID=E6PT32_9ZZZZ
MARPLAGVVPPFTMLVVARPRTPSNTEVSILLSIVEAAGWPIWPLIACSIAALAIILERLSSLRNAKVIPPRLLEEAMAVSISSIPSPDTIDKLERNSPLGMVLAAGFRAVRRPHATAESLREDLENSGRAVMHSLQRYLNALGTVASSAPLLGLLGTVVGLIEIFGSQTGGSTNPTLLAHGISVALYNTAFGLIIAVPSLMFYRYFRGRVDDFGIELEQAARRLATHLQPQLEAAARTSP